jgi:ribosomal-protein-alanine N-acetyltransferase
LVGLTWHRTGLVSICRSARSQNEHGSGNLGGVDWSPPDPALRAADLLLRPFRDDDSPAVAAACTDPAIGRFTFMKDGLTEDEARAWIAQSNKMWPHGYPRFAVVDAKDGRLLGQVGMAVFEQYQSAEAYYWVTATDRHRGVASTSLALLIDWAFEHGIERVYLLVHPENEASHRVAARCGFTREGVLRAFERVKGHRPDLVSWSLLPRDPRPWHRS